MTRYRFEEAFTRHDDGERLYVFVRLIPGDSRSEIVTVSARKFWQGAEPRTVRNG